MILTKEEFLEQIKSNILSLQQSKNRLDFWKIYVPFFIASCIGVPILVLVLLFFLSEKGMKVMGICLFVYVALLILVPFIVIIISSKKVTDRTNRRQILQNWNMSLMPANTLYKIYSKDNILTNANVCYVNGSYPFYFQAISTEHDDSIRFCWKSGESIGFSDEDRADQIASAYGAKSSDCDYYEVNGYSFLDIINLYLCDFFQGDYWIGYLKHSQKKYCALYDDLMKLQHLANHLETGHSIVCRRTVKQKIARHKSELNIHKTFWWCIGLVACAIFVPFLCSVFHILDNSVIMAMIVAFFALCFGAMIVLFVKMIKYGNEHIKVKKDKDNREENITPKQLLLILVIFFGSFFLFCWFLWPVLNKVQGIPHTVVFIVSFVLYAELLKRLFKRILKKGNKT